MIMNWPRFILAAFFAFCIGLAIAPAFAGGNHNITINNYYENPEPSSVTTVEQTTITSAVSKNDLAQGLAAAFAAGGHQFDFSTTDWQGSITGAWQLSDEEENAVSFGIAKRFDRFAQVLMHTNYTENGSDQWLVVGGTFRF